MEGINYAIALSLWLGMLLVAISNGYIGNAYGTPRLGE